jgi:hypothetical protein
MDLQYDPEREAVAAMKQPFSPLSGDLASDSSCR